MSSLGRVGILVKKRLRSVLQLVLPKAEKRHHEAPAAGSRSGEGVLLDARELGGMGLVRVPRKLLEFAAELHESLSLAESPGRRTLGVGCMGTLATLTVKNMGHENQPNLDGVHCLQRSGPWS
jgi:hypothetical protein